MQLFEYRPLRTDETTIRLIRLIAPDNTNTPEQAPSPSENANSDSGSDASPSTPPPDIGDIFHTPIVSAPPYVALSYVWGDSAPRHTVRFGGALVHVGDNLHAALQHLQPKANSPAVNVWIDALGINQACPVEKAQQIGHMREIYSRASAVVAWLGPAADDSDIAMRWAGHYGGRACKLGIGSKKELYLRRLLYAVDHEDRQGAEHRAVHQHVDHRDQYDHHTSVLAHDHTGELERFVRDAREQLAGETEEARRALAALRNLFLRDYWGRVWVIQEVKHGSGVTFVCGDIAVSEDHIHHTLRLMRNFAQYAKFSGATQDVARPQHDNLAHSALLRTNTEFCSESEPSPEPSPPTPSVVPTAKAILLLKARRTFGTFELAYLLRTFWGSGATDSRDLVFALLGLARDGDALGIRPDYVKPFAEVFADTTAALYKAGYMDLLAYCRPLAGVEVGEEGDGWPSWVPRFDLPVLRERLQQRGLVRGATPARSVLQPEFAASGDHVGTCVFSKCRESGLRTMSCKAVLVAVVGSLGSVWKPHNVGRWLQDLANLSQSMYNPSLGASKFPARVGEYAHLSGIGGGLMEARKSNHLRAVLRAAVADQEPRRGESKPRLSEEALGKAEDALKYDEDPVSLGIETLVARGLKTYVQQLEASARGRRPFADDGGLFGIGPCEMEPGDLIYVVTGATVPYVLRRDAQGKLRMIGDAYVHGKMDGEVMEGSPQLCTITIH